jgi:hypothetical protein
VEGETEDISKLTEVQEEEPEKEEVIEYSPDPDVRLVRNIWTRGNVEERVKNVKFMWGIFACNELLFKRFGMGESDKCSLCKGKETPWHVIGECPGERAVEIRTDWAKRMYVGTCTKGDHELESTAGLGRGKCAEANVEGGGGRSTQNVATRY